VSGSLIEPALAVIRAIHVAAMIVIVGGLAFHVLVARPAFAAAAAPLPIAGRFQRWQTAALAWTLGVALVSGAAWLVAEASIMSGQPVDALVDSGALGTVLAHTQFGEVWRWRAAVVPPLAAYLWLRHRRRATPLVLDAAATVLAAAWIVALGWVGHAAAMGGAAGAFHLAGHAIHLLAAAAWLGGLPALAFLLALAARAATPADGALAARLTKRFSALGLACVAALIATGIVNALFMVDTVAAFVDTPYGRLLTLKIGLFAAMLGIAARNRGQLAPRIGASVGAATPAVRELARNAVVEIVLGVGVILVVGFLAVTPPAHTPADAAPPQHHH
jgi:putative copper resistance protein D